MARATKTATATKHDSLKSPKSRAVARANIARAIRVGNGNALRHGLQSTVAIREEVRDEIAVLYARAPWLDPTRDGLLVEATARLIVRLRGLDDYLTGDKQFLQSQVLMTSYVRLQQLVRLHLVELGLTPKSAADLGVVKLDAAERARRLTGNALAAYRDPVLDEDNQR